MTVLVLVEHAQGELDELSLQALTFARGYAAGDGVDVVVAGPRARDTAGALGAHGVGTVHVAEHDALDEYAPLAWARAIAELVERLAPSAVVAAGSDRGTEVLAHAAVLTGAALAANCVRAVPGDPADVTRLRWGGSLLEEARLHGPVKLMTVAPHAVPAEPAAAAEPVVAPFTPALREQDLVVRVSERVDTSTGGLSLAEAPVVVSGGRGVGSAEGFAPLEELRGAAGRRRGLLARGDQRGVAAAHRPGGADGDEDRAGPLHHVRDQRRDAAHGRLQGREEAAGHQLRRGGADHGQRGLRRDRRLGRDRAGDHRRAAGGSARASDAERGRPRRRPRRVRRRCSRAARDCWSASCGWASSRASSAATTFPDRLREEAVVVLGQRKLLQRLVPGLMHAFIFWGFLVLFPTIVIAMIGIVDREATLPGSASRAGSTRSSTCSRCSR